MRNKIIQYLQGIKCEWFPVEWDPFFSEYIQMAEGNDMAAAVKQIKYRFYENIAYHTVRDGDCSGEIALQYAFYYGSLDRCKLLLLNAVRSVDEPKKITAGEIINGYEIEIDGNDVRVYALRGSVPRCRIVWKNGEFK